MATFYDHKAIEKKWQTYWLDHKTFRTDVTDFSKPKFYILDMFPYPSAQGLHVGHPRGYTATDVLARFKRNQGFNVLHPMGWDAFGLPAEQYAIKTGQHPRHITHKNIDNFRRQIQSLGFSYDWEREFSTTDVDYVRWTQWIFTKLYEKGLAYVDEIPVNWCPELGTVLANEEVVDGKSEVGGFPVIRKPVRQWILKITEYADRLLEDLNGLDWPHATLEMQRNWIGKSEGVEITFHVDQLGHQFDVFTTRVDTLFGCTYVVLAPEHPLVDVITTPAQREVVQQYQKEVQGRSDLMRTELNKDKTGVFTGAYAINPVNQRRVPIWVADYVLASYGSGAVMAVPAHDQRDYEFATKYNLAIVGVLEGDISKQAFVDDAPHIHSEFANGLLIAQAKEAIAQFLEQHGVGKRKVNFKLRDWLFSRQRYWGEPIPIVHLPNGKMHVLSGDDLPLELPALDDFRPSGNGESPLSKSTDWLTVTIDGQVGRRETNTMPQWAGSCWYYLRFIDPKNKEAIGAPELLQHWLPVDQYIGGAEHAVLHLLYARFWHKVLYDIGVVTTKEPFQNLFHQGMILGDNGEKMSKSRGNVVNPDDIVESHGADTLRLYEMFIGPLDASLPWSTQGLDGARRFLDRVYRLYTESEYTSKMTDVNDHSLDKVAHRTYHKVAQDIEGKRFNTAISQLMIFINEAYKAPSFFNDYADQFLILLSSFAPHLAEELWHVRGHDESLAYVAYPAVNPEFLKDDEVEMAVQVNGKLRATFMAAVDADAASLQAHALSLEAVQRHINGQPIRKVIVVPKKIVNIVI